MLRSQFERVFINRVTLRLGWSEVRRAALEHNGGEDGHLRRAAGHGAGVRQGLTLVHVRAQVEQLQDTFLS